MTKALQWVIGIGVVLLVAALVFSSLAPFFLPRIGMAGYPMMGWPGHMFGPGHMVGMRGWGLPLFGLFGLAWVLWPLLIIGLIVWALMTLVRPRPQPPLAPYSPMAPTPPAPVSQAVCSQCGQPLQPGWRHCPNCGRAVGA